MRRCLKLPKKKKKVTGVGINDANYQVAICKRDGERWLISGHALITLDGGV